jgi:asparagine N-glycosylation enzyme membrane subunit Stt3
MAALQLPSLIFSHWLSQALMVFSLVTGLFSVYAACTQQRLVTNLATPVQMRAWLSTPKHPSQGSGT